MKNLGPHAKTAPFGTTNVVLVESSTRTTKTQGNGSTYLIARVGTSTKMTEIYRSIFKNILTKNAIKNVKVAIPKLSIAISENLFQNRISLATET